MTVVVAAFYKFVALPDFAEQQAPLLAYCTEQNIKGTILLAQEGINGTIAGCREGIDAVFNWLRRDPRLADLTPQESFADEQPFQRMKVKLKSEIVTLGLPDVNPSDQVGTYVEPTEWNDLISDPTVTVIDTRNAFEVRVGTFQRAQDPQTQSFRQFPDYVRQNLDPAQHPKVAMFCTGGIRCEKATAFLLKEGFKEVYHLKGGILRYLKEVPPEESLWEGECFVFDERVAVSHGLEPAPYELCGNCGHPISEDEKNSPEYQAGESCPYCCDRASETPTL